MSIKSARICKKGHRYFKSSDCPTCPVCEKERKPSEGFLSEVSVPARRALENAGLTSLKKLAKYSESDLLKLHGIGPSSLPKLKNALKSQGLSFRK